VIVYVTTEMQFASDYILLFAKSPLVRLGKATPWELTSNSIEAVDRLLTDIGSDYQVVNNVAMHRTAIIEGQASIKGPVVIGPRCFIAATSLIRGGCWLDENCVVGPASELKSSFIFRGSKLAHFNFVGDSILGSDVNLEAGSIIANRRNELPGSTIRIVQSGESIETGVQKFGALIGDGCKLGANAVVAPGTVLKPETIVPRLGLVDQYSE
jgi:UDP-N-acetylglucosamine diphosphorylase / glucose-1-phosphate thymidylyltransferase / UDP-N-acetylgalactosamine diphosphorylase / glucosamine-1-phosphate N-acetyltransferase / galactosamine-1-phosphate N-acetyltransferase